MLVKVIRVSKNDNCIFLTLEVYSWTLLPYKHILLRLAGPHLCALHNKHAEVLGYTGTWYESIRVCRAHLSPALLGMCLSILSSLSP